MLDRDNTSDVTALTVQLLSVYLTNNPVASKDFADLVRSTRAALSEDLARPTADSSATSSGANSAVSDGGTELSIAHRKRAALGSAPRAKAGQRKVKVAALPRSSRNIAVSPDAASPPNAGLIAGGSPRTLAQPPTAASSNAATSRPSTKSSAIGPKREKANKDKAVNSRVAAAPAKSSRTAKASSDGTPSNADLSAESASPAPVQREPGTGVAADRGEQPATSRASAPKKATTRKADAINSKGVGTAAGASLPKGRRSASATKPRNAPASANALESVSSGEPAASSVEAEVADRMVPKAQRTNRPKPGAAPSKAQHETAPAVAASITDGSQDAKTSRRGKLSLFAKKSAEKPSDSAPGVNGTLAGDAPVAGLEVPRKVAKPKRMARAPAAP